jgi:anti-sigma B factor antagonist
MELKTTEINKSCIRIHLVGQCWEKEDFSQLKKTIQTYRMENIRNVVLDLTRLSFISSEGLGLLISLFKEMQNQNGRLLIYKPRENVGEIIKLSGLYDILKIIDTEKQLQEAVIA